MFIPDSFRVTDPQVIFSFIETFAFATLVTAPVGAPIQVTHLPLILDRRKDSVLAGHFARENPHWRYLEASGSLAIFQGPHAYISPTWYRESPAVPTWNYAVVHVHGLARLVEDRGETRDILGHLVQRYEAGRPHPWQPEQVPSEYYDQMTDRIVAFRMPVGRIEAKFKLGQNRTAGDRHGLVEGLLSEPVADAKLLAEFVRRYAGEQG